MIVGFAVSVVAVALFGVVLYAAGIAGTARRAMQATTGGVSAMLDPELDDDHKEVAVRQAGFELIRVAFRIFATFALALGAAALPVYLADLAGIVPGQAVIDLMSCVDYIIGVSVAAIVLTEVVRRLRRPQVPATEVGEEARYSAADRLLHNFAFASPGVLRKAAWLEDRVIGDPAPLAAEAPPVFITSLARGGTTAVLNALHDLPGVATHIYRDMPFMTAPILWNRLSGGKRRRVERHQRAHGDGLEIDLDTPEAFEEILWKMHWPEKYRDDRIALWTPQDDRPEANRFLNRHMARIVQARRQQAAQAPSAVGRYCSKNNANIARLAYLSAACPQSAIVVPVRRPQSHAASLLRQHRNFVAQQTQSDFVRRYMRDIGHFEFGLIHKPFAFPGVETLARHDPMTPDYWLAYWILSFEHVLQHSEACIFVLQDDLRAAPQDTMEQLCARVQIDPGGTDFTRYFRDSPDRVEGFDCDPDLLARAEDIYRALTQAAARQGAPG